VALLLDLFSYVSIILHGLTITAQAATLGGIFFLLLLARPLGPLLGAAGPGIARMAARTAGWAALCLVASAAINLALQCAVLVATVEISLVRALSAAFALAGAVKIAAAALLAVLLLRRGATPQASILIALGVIVLAAATLTTHAAARLEARAPLLAISALHQIGAAIWIGGLPCFLRALTRIDNGSAWRIIGARFSRMAMAGVAVIVVSGVLMSLNYIGSWQGFYGTAYGVMVGAKIAMLLMLLGLGASNFFVVERLRGNTATSINRLRRFTEVEIGIGLTIFFAAASLTSVAPAIDVGPQQVTWAEIAERNTPRWPSLASPAHDMLAIPALQAKLDAEAKRNAETGHAAHMPAFVPGAGELPPRNAADIAWSEYNHHWSGIFLVVIGLLAVVERAGLRVARHWPLVFLGLAGFLLLRSDPEVWPLGQIGFWESLRDVEVLQHHAAALLVAVFAVFEWRVRADGLGNSRAALVFPIVSALGGALLLTHSHAIANLKDQLLIELSHTPLAIAGIATGWARWLELRLDPPGNRIAGWIWPPCLLLVGLILLDYREA